MSKKGSLQRNFNVIRKNSFPNCDYLSCWHRLFSKLSQTYIHTYKLCFWWYSYHVIFLAQPLEWGETNTHTYMWLASTILWVCAINYTNSASINLITWSKFSEVELNPQNTVLSCRATDNDQDFGMSSKFSLQLHSQKPPMTINDNNFCDSLLSNKIKEE